MKCDTTIPVGMPTCMQCGASRSGEVKAPAGPAPGILKAAPPPKPGAAKKGARRIPKMGDAAVQKRLQRNMEQRASMPKMGVKLVIGAVTLVVAVVGGYFLFNAVTTKFEKEQGEKLILEDHATINFDQVAAFEINITEHTNVFVRVESTGECTGHIINRKHFSGSPLRDDIGRLRGMAESAADDIVIRSGSGVNFQIIAPVAGGHYGVFICNWLPGEKTQEVKVKVTTSHHSFSSRGPSVVFAGASALVDPVAQDPDVDRLIRDLVADDVETREKATRALVSKGSGVLPQVRAALDRETDAEAKARLRAVLRELDSWFESRLLATFSAREEKVGRIVFAPDGRRVAYVVSASNDAQVFVNDQGGPKFQCVTELFFAPDGREVVSEGVRGGEWNAIGGVTGGKHVVVKGSQESEEYDDYVLTYVFSPDGKSMAYAARKDGKAFVVVDGKKGEAFDDVGSPVLSPDGKTLAYAANLGGTRDGPGSVKGGQWFVVVDGKRGEAFDRVTPPVFTPAGKPAYGARRGGKGVLVVDDRTSEAYEVIWTAPIFSRDGKHTAFVAGERGKQIVVEDGRKHEAFDHIWELTFSPDGTRLAYAAWQGSKCVYVIDGQKGPEFSAYASGTLQFSPDGSSVAYEGVINDDHVLMVDGKKCDASYSYSGRVYSPDGKRCAYVSARIVSRERIGRGEGEFIEQKMRVVSGDKKGEEFDTIGHLLFGPDGRTVAYIGHNSHSTLSGYFCIVGEKKSEEFNFASAPVFGPDGKRVGFGARIGRELWWKVVDVE